jgi:vitamin B12 transporter
MKKLPIFSLLLFFIPDFTNAQDTAKTLPLVQVSSQRLDRLFIGQNSANIDSISMQQYENQSLTNLISTQTAIPIKSYSTGLATISMRGMGAAQTAILWNGFDIRAASTGLNELGIFPVGFSQIRIKSGSGTALYGSGAIGGTLLLDSEAPVINDFKMNFDQTFGSFGTRATTLGLAGGKKKTTISSQIQHQKADNDFSFKNYSLIGQPIQKQANAKNNVLNAMLNFRVQLSDNQILKASSWWSDADRESPFSMTSANTNAKQKDQSFRNMLEWVLLKNEKTSRLRGAFFDEKFRYSSDAVDNSNYRILTYIAEGEHTRPTFKNIKNGQLRLGGNFTYQSAENSTYNDLKIRQRLALFASQINAWKTGKIALNLRQEMVNGTLNPFTFLLGTEQRIFKNIDLIKKIVVRGSISKNFSLPALNDLYYENVGNPNLLSESGWSEEIGFDVFYKEMCLKTTFFHIEVNNWIQWSPKESGIWRPYNLKNVTSNGAEIDFQWQLLNKPINQNIEIKYRLAFTEDDLFVGKQLIFIPIHSAMFGWTLQHKKTTFRWTKNYSSQRFSTATNTESTAAYTLSNLYFSYSFPIKKTKLSFALSLDNVFNQAYEVIKFYPNPGRSVLLSFVFKY